MKDLKTSPWIPSPSALRHQSSAIGRNAAFTLIELLVVITVIAILASLTLAISGGANQKAALDKARAEVTAIANALEQYKSVNDAYPPAGSGNTVPFAPTGATIRPFYTAARIQTNSSGQLEDPYGNAYQYQSPGSRNPASFDVWSRGKNGITDAASSNSTDDIGNW
jgi:general secretion pathway protein G